MSNPEEPDTCRLDLYPESMQETQETYYEGASNENLKIIDETQNASLNESQDFNLIVSEGDDSMVERKKQNEKESNLQKSVERMDSQTPELSPETQQTADNDANSNESKKEEAVEKKGDVSGELERKDDHSDEDEDIIQGTPPQNYSSPSRKIGGVDVTSFSLKRKVRTADELPPAKVLRTKDATNVEKPSGEESCDDSNDSYQELFKNIDKNVVIEETQDLTNPEFTQNSLKIPAVEHAADEGEAHTEQNDNQRDKAASSEKNDNLKTKLTNDNPSVLRNYNKDDSQLNDVANESTTATVADESLSASSAKLTDTSVNDSTIVNINYNGDGSQPRDDLSVEMKADDASTSVVTTDEASGIGTKSVKDMKKSSSDKKTEEECVESTAKRTVDDNDEDEDISSSQTKSRTSVELIFEGANSQRAASDGDGKSKPQVVQIDDDGEKILDSSVEMACNRPKGVRTPKPGPEIVQIDDSHEDNENIVVDLLEKSAEIQVADKSSYESKGSSHDHSYRSMESMKESSLDSKLTVKRLVNGSSDSKKSDTDITLSVDSDASFVSDEITVTRDVRRTDGMKGNIMDTDFISISDNETSNIEEKSKSDLARTKTMQVEREIGVYLKFKCLLHVNKNTKEPVSKELTAVHCEPVMIEPRQKIEDSSLDISNDKIDSSPGSVNSNPQLYTLNPCRLSILSSSSSASSAASLQAKLARNAHFFPVPLGPAKHAKKSSSQETLPDRQLSNDTYDHLTREWKNHHLLTEMILNYANMELSGITTIAAATGSAVVDIENMNNERLDDPHHLTVKSDNMRSSTPSEQPATTSKVEPVTVTPKSTTKGKAVKRPRSKLAKSNANINAQINREDGDKILVKPHASELDTPSRANKSKTAEQDDTLSTSDGNLIEQAHSNSMLNDELIGCKVFAKWSDNNYYPGTVSNQLKGKYKVNFYDGKSKVLIPEFVIPIPKTLREGLSVYATTKTNDYSVSCYIVDVQTTPGDDNDIYYMVETDKRERLRVQLPNISLTPDQAQVLKEEVENSTCKSTPKALAQVTLDNVVDGKRRSKRLGTPSRPVFSTPKSVTKSIASTSTYKTSKSEPSVSGMSSTKATVGWENEEGISSDSNIESIQPLVQDKYAMNGTQREIIGTPYEQIMKGPPSKIKSKPRSKKKKVEDPQIIETLGPIPNSQIFKGMSFIFTCASLETLDRYVDMKSARSSAEESTETDTENENEWVDRPFVRDRLHTQITEGGGKIYLMGMDLDILEEFEQIPKDEYNNTTLITNVPNTTPKYLLCLSVGIRICSHKWIIKCCEEKKILNARDFALPNGWSLQKKTYIEAFQTGAKKSLSEVVIIIPSVAFEGQYVTFWRQVCENAGAVVLFAEDSGTIEMMDFNSGNVVVVSNRECPLWVLNSATQLQIPVLSTTWVIQCIIEGKLCPKDHPRYRYNY